MELGQGSAVSLAQPLSGLCSFSTHPDSCVKGLRWGLLQFLIDSLGIALTLDAP